MYNQGRQDVAPWRMAGAAALGDVIGEVASGPGEFTESPYYNFLRDEGIRAIDRSAASRGLLGSGRTLKGIERFGQGLAATEYQNWLNNWLQTRVNPLMSLAGLGQVSAGQTANMGQAFGQGAGQSYLAGGQGQAGGYINQANAITGGSNALNQLINNAMFYDYLGRR
jgi:hypothetical protein